MNAEEDLFEGFLWDTAAEKDLADNIAGLASAVSTHLASRAVQYLSSLVLPAAAAVEPTTIAGACESFKSECVALVLVLRKLPARFSKVEGVFSALELLQKLLDCAKDFPLLSSMQDFSEIPDQCSAIMDLGNMESLESLLSGHESHCHVQNLAKLQKNK